MEIINNKQPFYRRRLKNYAIVFDALIAFLFFISAFTTLSYSVHDANPYHFWFGGQRLIDREGWYILLPVFILPVIALVCRIKFAQRKILLNGLEGLVLCIGIFAVFLVMMIGVGEALGGAFGCGVQRGVSDIHAMIVRTRSTVYCYKSQSGVTPLLIYLATGLAVVFMLIKLGGWIWRIANHNAQKQNAAELPMP